MRKKGSSYDESGGPNWLDTYADMVTLLLTFFVLLFSMSTINAEKWKMLVNSFAGAVEVDPPRQFVVNPDKNHKPGDGVLQGQEDNLPVKSPEDIQEFDDLYKYFKEYVKKNNLQSDIEIYKGNGYTFMTFRNNIFFDGDSSVLKPEGKKILDVLNDSFVNITDQIGKVKFAGHTARCRGAKTPNDLEQDRQLSSQRAVNVLCYIQGKGVIDGAKLTSTGLGEFHPVVKHDGTEKTRIKNRRVEIYIIKQGSKEMNLDNVYKEINEQKNNK